MKHIQQKYKGDITLFVTIIVSAIMLILLLALSQKITVESRISRENLYAQQALQAANTGIDAWQYQWTQTSNISIATPGQLSNWPNSNSVLENKTTDSLWIILSQIGLSSIQYQVKFQPENTTAGTPPLIIAKGRVVRGNTIIERTLEQQFKISAPTTPTAPLLSTNFNYVTPWAATWYCSAGSCYRNGTEALAIKIDGNTSITLQAAGGAGPIINTFLSSGNMCGSNAGIGGPGVPGIYATYQGVVYATGGDPVSSGINTAGVTSIQYVDNNTVNAKAALAGCTISYP